MKTMTSENSPIGLADVVPKNEKGGWVAITLAPGKRTQGTYVRWERDLEADMAKLKELRTTVLVPFLTDGELDRLKIPGYFEAAEAHGIRVVRFPFHDGGIPHDVGSATVLIQFLESLYHRGERIVMHCNGGLGRAGTMAACLRLMLGLDANPAGAIASVRAIRSRRAIETKAQEQFVERMEAFWWDKYTIWLMQPGLDQGTRDMLDKFLNEGVQLIQANPGAPKYDYH